MTPHLEVEEAEVAEAGHPDVGRDKHTDGVVHLKRRRQTPANTANRQTGTQGGVTYRR